MLGGEAAAKAGFTLDEASQSSPLWHEKKKDDDSIPKQQPYQGGSSYV
jgi:hypothetical protein